MPDAGSVPPGGKILLQATGEGSTAKIDIGAAADQKFIDSLGDAAQASANLKIAAEYKDGSWFAPPAKPITLPQIKGMTGDTVHGFTFDWNLPFSARPTIAAENTGNVPLHIRVRAVSEAGI
jgi:hypothetical protein